MNFFIAFIGKTTAFVLGGGQIGHWNAPDVYRFSNETRTYCWFSAGTVVIAHAMRLAQIETPEWRQQPRIDDPIEVVLTSWNRTLRHQVVCPRPLMENFLRYNAGFNLGEVANILNHQQELELLFEGMIPDIRRQPPRLGAPFFQFLWTSTKTRRFCSNSQNASFGDAQHPLNESLVILEPFKSLDLPESQNTTLQQHVINWFTNAQELEADVQCPSCAPGSVPHRMMRMERLNAAPQFLLINFQRMRQVVRNGRLVFAKDNTRLQIAANHRILLPIGFGDERATFELVSAVEHTGADIARGHFVAHLRINNHWWCVNDASPLVPTASNSPGKAKLFVFMHIPN